MPDVKRALKALNSLGTGSKDDPLLQYYGSLGRHQVKRLATNAPRFNTQWRCQSDRTPYLVQAGGYTDTTVGHDPFNGTAGTSFFPDQCGNGVGGVITRARWQAICEDTKVLSHIPVSLRASALCPSETIPEKNQIGYFEYTDTQTITETIGAPAETVTVTDTVTKAQSTETQTLTHYIANTTITVGADNPFPQITQGEAIGIGIGVGMLLATVGIAAVATPIACGIYKCMKSSNSAKVRPIEIKVQAPLKNVLGIPKEAQI